MNQSMNCQQPEVFTHAYWLFKGRDGQWYQPDISSTPHQAIEAARRNGTAYRYVTSTEIVQHFEL